MKTAKDTIGLITQDSIHTYIRHFLLQYNHKTQPIIQKGNEIPRQSTETVH